MNTARCKQLLQEWLARQASEDGLSWLTDRLERTASGDRRAFLLGFGMTARKLGKHDLRFRPGDLEAASHARPAWNPEVWTVDQAARALFVLSLPQEDPDAFGSAIEEVFASADVGELVALYQTLPLLAFPERFAGRAAEGIRTNMTAVFRAVAHRNPFPSEQLDENAWNQMILKCLFVGAQLDPVVGLDERANPKLASMLVDFAHERWAAKRTVSPELWRPVGPFADDRALNDLARILEEGHWLEKEAAILALRVSDASRAGEILASYPDLVRQAIDGEFDWHSIARKLVQAY